MKSRKARRIPPSQIKAARLAVEAYMQHRSGDLEFRDLRILCDATRQAEAEIERLRHLVRDEDWLELYQHEQDRAEKAEAEIERLNEALEDLRDNAEDSNRIASRAIEAGDGERLKAQLAAMANVYDKLAETIK